MPNKLYFLGVLTLLAVAMALIVQLLLPVSFGDALWQLLLTTVATAALWMGPAFITWGAKWVLQKGEEALIRLPGRVYDWLSDRQRIVIQIVLALFIGFLWLIMPEYLVIEGGWYQRIITGIGYFQYGTVHWPSAISAFIISLVWFHNSDDNGRWF